MSASMLGPVSAGDVSEVKEFVHAGQPPCGAALTALNGPSRRADSNQFELGSIRFLVKEIHMNVGSVCTRRIVRIDSGGTLAQAARLMREHHVGALVVTSEAPEGLRVGGIVTDRDLVMDVLARELDGTAVRIGELASREVVSVSENDDLTDAIAAMQETGVRRLLVTNADQQLVGVVSLDDLIDVLASQLDGLAKVIRSGMQREVDEAAAAPPPAPVVLRIPAMGTAGWGKAIA
jgi:CBS domain-containing protein